MLDKKELKTDFARPTAVLVGIITPDQPEEKAKEYLKAVIDKHDIEYYYAIAEIKIAEGHPELASKYLKRKADDIDEDDDVKEIVKKTQTKKKTG